MEKTALVPIAEGCEEMEAVTIIDVLRRAGASVTVAGVDALQITASRGVRLVADQLISDCTGNVYDMIALPGGIPGAANLRDCDALTHLLKKQHAEGRWIGAICAAPAVVLAHHGLLANRKATCHPNFIGQIDRNSATEDRVVVDGPCITSRGPGTALAFALELVAALYGKEKAAEVAAPMVIG
ncbi:MAG: DJ-1/PfpI family protein [Desulfobacterales bacterium]|jgi:4-methyl-5(b-hydroxyethyl)-thiazole monophosphate biosynthesis|nr:DJ-1/PfpI family protein [Desulfobacterales bacterium]